VSSVKENEDRHMPSVPVGVPMSAEMGIEMVNPLPTTKSISVSVELEEHGMRRVLFALTDPLKNVARPVCHDRGRMIPEIEVSKIISTWENVSVQALTLEEILVR
jgi:hypothetical protein